MSANVLLEEIRKALPPVLYRTNPRFRELTGLSPRTMANLDSKGQGPAQRVRLGKSVGYPKEAIMKWLAERIQIHNQ
jgi:predicted DNA-binding transcriptional regulator AlpA